MTDPLVTSTTVSPHPARPGRAHGAGEEGPRARESLDDYAEDLPPAKEAQTPVIVPRGAQLSAADGTRLVVKGEIGSGTFGTVLLCDAADAADPAGGGGGVALKVLPREMPGAHNSRRQEPPFPNRGNAGAEGCVPPSGFEVWKREERIMRKASHRNVVKVHQSWETEAGYLLAMEYAARGDAFDVVDYYGGPCPETLAAKIALGLFSALSHIHSKGIVHRDVKPENVFIKDDGDVVLGDFGLAGEATDPESTFTTPCGTMTYRAPEMLGEQAYTNKVDVWAAGLTVYTCLTGQDPWATTKTTNANVAAIMRKIATARVNKYPSHVSCAARDFISKCLAVDPSKRFSADKAIQHRWLRLAHVFDRDELPVRANKQEL